MPNTSRSAGRGSRAVSSTIRKMDKQSKGSTPPPPRISSRVRSNVPRSTFSYQRRVRTPPQNRKTNTRRSPPKRRLSPSPQRHIIRKNREDTRIPAKKRRDSSLERNSSKSPRQLQSSLVPTRRPLSREHHSYTERSDSTRVITRRSRTPEKKFAEKSYESSSKGFSYNLDDLKNIKFNVWRRNFRDLSDGSLEIDRRIIDPENITVVRRPAYSSRDQDLVDMESNHISRASMMPSWSLLYLSRRRKDRGEGSTPIFDRQEIIENTRKYEADDLKPSRSEWLPEPNPTISCDDNYRSRDYYCNKEKNRNLSNSRRSSREYDHKVRDDRSREEIKYQPSTSVGRSRSYDRLRDYTPERKDRCGSRDVYRVARRSLDRERSRPDDRLVRRHASPADTKRHFECKEYDERRTRSSERRDVEMPPRYKDHHDYAPGDRFSNSDPPSKSRGYYEVEERENSSSRGSSFYSRGRGGGVHGRSFMRSSGFTARQVPPGRLVRMAPVPRVPIIGRRPPFPPRKSFRGSLQSRR